MCLPGYLVCVYVCLQNAFRKADWRSRRASNSIVRAV